MRNIFIELTNPIHGGVGWEFGTCLWSPTLNKSGHDTWKNMRKPRRGDIIIHSYNTATKPHVIQGLSIVDKECYITDVEPEKAETWSGYDHYYRIDLMNYKEVPRKKPLQSFLDEYFEKLTKYHKRADIKGTFYDKNLKVAQKYLESVDYEVFQYILEYLNISNVDRFLNIVDNNTSSFGDLPDEIIPERRNVIISRKIRDTKIIQTLKNKYDNKCQICGQRIQIGENKYYSEGAHIVPLGSPYNGSDTKDNVLILCPNHHVAFDYGYITINHTNGKIETLTVKEKTLTRPLVKHQLNKKYLKKHNDYIYQGKIKKT